MNLEVKTNIFKKTYKKFLALDRFVRLNIIIVAILMLCLTSVGVYTLFSHADEPTATTFAGPSPIPATPTPIIGAGFQFGTNKLNKIVVQGTHRLANSVKSTGGTHFKVSLTTTNPPSQGTITTFPASDQITTISSDKAGYFGFTVSNDASAGTYTGTYTVTNTDTQETHDMVFNLQVVPATFGIGLPNAAGGRVIVGETGTVMTLIPFGATRYQINSQPIQGVPEITWASGSDKGTFPVSKNGLQPLAVSIHVDSVLPQNKTYKSSISISNPDDPTKQEITIPITIRTLAPGFTVNGNALLFNNHPFIPYGFNMVAALGQAGCFTDDKTDPLKGKLAALNFGDKEMQYMLQNWGHPTIVRFQISEPALAGYVPGTDPATYLQTIQNDVQVAEKYTSGVILSMQDQAHGCGWTNQLPTVETKDAWTKLAPVFKNDARVMYELYNEPQAGTENSTKTYHKYVTTTADWQQWKWGGNSPLVAKTPVTTPTATRPVINPTPQFIGMQDVVNVIRSTGANNVLLADASNWSETFEGISQDDPAHPGQTFLLSDPNPDGRGIIYAVHPYGGYFSPALWDTYFGTLSSTLPVIVSEWALLGVNPTATTDLHSCDPDNTGRYFTYLKAHNIGLISHAFDVHPFTTVRTGTLDSSTGLTDWNNWVPTTCTATDTSQKGGGQDVQNLFNQLQTTTSQQSTQQFTPVSTDTTNVLQ